MRFLHRWWPLLATIAVVGAIAVGLIVAEAHDPPANTGHPIPLIQPTAMTDNVRTQP